MLQADLEQNYRFHLFVPYIFLHYHNLTTFSTQCHVHNFQLLFYVSYRGLSMCLSFPSWRPASPLFGLPSRLVGANVWACLQTGQTGPLLWDKHKTQTSIHKQLHSYAPLRYGCSTRSTSRQCSLFARSSIVWVVLDAFLRCYLIINRWCQRFGGLSVWQGISINTDFLSISVCITLLTFNYGCGDVCYLCIQVWGELWGNSFTLKTSQNTTHKWR